MRSLTILFAALYLLMSCQDRYPEGVEVALELAGDNRGELERVIEHYAQDPADSLKLRAAYFLIKNMPYHQFQDFSETYQPALDSLVAWQQEIAILRDSLQKLPSNILAALDTTKASRALRKSLFVKALKNISSNVTGKLRQDILLVDADFLISNIDLAFEAHQRLPIAYHSDFENFCEYVLPYRSSDEPLELDTRRMLYNKYSWLYDSLERTGSLNKVVEILVKNVVYPKCWTVDRLS